MRKFNIGILSIGVLIGFLVGASNSPVAGAAITAIFAVAASVATIFGQIKIKEIPEPSKETSLNSQRSMNIDAALNNAGVVLVVFSISFGAGLGIGIYARLHLNNKTQVSFPWAGANAPASGRLAIDWILVQEKLKLKGFSDQQIQELYVTYSKPTNPTVNILDLQPTLSSLLKEEQAASKENSLNLIATNPDLRGKKNEGIF